MAVFANNTDVETIEINDARYGYTINQNFRRFTSIEEITFTTSDTYIISDSLLYSGTEVDQYSFRTFFVDTSARSGNVTIQLPDPALKGNRGKELIFIRKDGTAPDTAGQKILFTVTGSTSLQGKSGYTDMEKKAGLRMVITSNGTEWYGMSEDG